MPNEMQVAPDAATQNNAFVPTETPEVVADTEISTEAKPPERDKRDDTISRMRGRINQKHGEAAAANERARILEERIAKYEQGQSPEKREKVEVDPNELERAIETRAEERVRLRTLNDRCNDVAAKGKKAFADFDASLAVMREELPLFNDKGPTPALEAILEMDNPPALIDYLGKNPDIAAELADLSPYRLTRRLDQIEREMKPTRQPAKTPQPLEPVKSTSAPSEPDVKDTARWIKWANAQEAKK